MQKRCLFEEDASQADEVNKNPVAALLPDNLRKYNAKSKSKNKLNGKREFTSFLI